MRGVPDSRAQLRRSRPASSFIGRRAELDALSRLLGEARLVTILGPGGIGKTRLALRACEDRIAELDDDEEGALFIDLSEARTPYAALTLVASAFGLSLGELGETEAADTIADGLARRGSVWLVLDNIEQIAPGIGPAIERWIARASNVRFVATSRAVLGIAGEHVLTLDALTRDDAVALFEARRRAAGGPTATPDPEGAVAEIVEAIDRMPLAIELAASRTRLLSLSELRRRLDRPLDVLSDPSADHRAASVRRAVMDSVALLGEEQRRFFALVSVLQNGFRLDDAEAVLGDVAIPRASVLDALDVLVRSSLLRTTYGEPVRHAFFVTIREVAEDLAREDVALPAVLRAHASHYAARARTLGVELMDELDNALVAHRTAIRLAQGERSPTWVADALGIATALDDPLAARGRSSVREALFDGVVTALDALEADRGAAADRARALLGRGAARRELGDTGAAEADFADALQLAKAAGDERLLALALARAGALDDVRSDTAQARTRLEEALSLLARTDEGAERTALEARVSLDLGHAHRREGRLEEAERALSAAASRYRQLGDEPSLAAALYEQAVVSMFAGDAKEALARIGEGLEVARRAGARIMEGTLLTARGGLMQEAGELSLAREALAEAASILADLGNRHREASALYYLATTYVESGDAEDALALLARARQRIATVRSPRYDALIAACSASALAQRGRAEEARAAIATAEVALTRVSGEPALEAAVRTHRDGVELACGDTAVAADAALRMAEARVERASNDDSRFALRALKRLASGRMGALPEDALLVLGAGEGFRLPGGASVEELPERSPMRAILDHLTRRRIEAPGEPVPLSEIIEAGWPGERMGERAALNRAHVAMSTLRKRGLRDLLVRTGGGYALSAAIPVRRGTRH
ncbi:MAG: AAA family ATPase [Sandaracinaceae bacterium]